MSRRAAATERAQRDARAGARCPAGPLWRASARARGGVGRLMDRSGRLIDLWLDRSGGFPVLDAEALATLSRAQPLPLIPQNIPERLQVVVPVAFTLMRLGSLRTATRAGLQGRSSRLQRLFRVISAADVISPRGLRNRGRGWQRAGLPGWPAPGGAAAGAADVFPCRAPWAATWWSLSLSEPAETASDEASCAPMHPACHVTATLRTQLAAPAAASRP
jgi:TonB family protein